MTAWECVFVDAGIHRNRPSVQASFFSSQVKSQVKSTGRICFKSSHDQVKSGQNIGQVIKSSHQVKRLEHPYRCSSQLFSSQVKSQVKSTGRICFKSSHNQVKSGQNFGQVIKSSHQVKLLEHPGLQGVGIFNKEEWGQARDTDMQLHLEI